MPVPEWDELPEEIRARVDELLLNGDEWFAATNIVWKTGIRLLFAKSVVFRRRTVLGDRIQRPPEAPRDPETLIAKIEAMPVRPDAIEATWDGDTEGWMVDLLAVTRDRGETHLATIRHGSDLRLLNGVVPPWPEAQEAVETGAEVARHFGIPFYFASPEVPGDYARWWDTV